LVLRFLTSCRFRSPAGDVRLRRKLKARASVRWIVLAFVGLALGACASRTPIGVELSEPSGGGVASYDGTRFDVPVALRVKGARMVTGTAKWNQSAVVSDLDVDVLRAQDYLFPIGEMLERTTREALEGPFESVVSGTEAPIRVETRLGDFQLLHGRKGSEALVRVDVRYRILDAKGREIQQLRHQGSARSPFDGRRTPDALWSALEQAAIKLRASLASSSDLAVAIEETRSRRLTSSPRPPPALRPEPVDPRTRYAPGYRRKVAVVIGINDYDAWPALEGAAADARAVAETLRARDFEVVEIYDGEATRSRILALLGEELPQRLEAETLVVIFFAGHGHTETLPNGEKRGYIIPVDGAPRRVYSTSISMRQIRDLSNRLPAKHVYYAMDSCYSGLGFTRGISILPTADRFYDKVTSKRVVQMITAGQEGEQAIERGGRGIFTSYLIEALSGDADYNGDGFVSASEIGAFVPSAVTQATDGRQTPRFGTLEGSGEVVFDLP
jgi:hypothetical protein